MDKLETWQAFIDEYRYDTVKEEFWGECVVQGSVDCAEEYGICTAGMTHIPVDGEYYTAFEFDEHGALPTIENWKTLLWQMGHGRYTRDELAPLAEACFIHGYAEIGSAYSSATPDGVRNIWRICTCHLPDECIPAEFRLLDFTSWRIREYIAETVDDLLDSAAEQLKENYAYETSVDATLERLAKRADDDPDFADVLNQLGNVGDCYDELR